MAGADRHVDCCARPSLRVIHTFDGASPRKSLVVERCKCGAHWLHHWAEVNMGGFGDDDDDVEIDFDWFAKLTEIEAGDVTKSREPCDFAFLAERDVISVRGEDVSRRQGRDAPW